MDADDQTPEEPAGKREKKTGGAFDMDRYEMAVADRMALELRRDGYSYPQIADKLECAVSTAHQRVKRALRAVVAEPAADVLTMERERLDKLLAKALAIAEFEDPGEDGPEVADRYRPSVAERLTALNTALRISESRRKLEGIDAPTKHEHRIFDALDAQIEQLASELAAVELGVDEDAAPASSEV